MAKIQRTVSEDTGFGINKSRIIAPSASDGQINAMMGDTFNSLKKNPFMPNADKFEVAAPAESEEKSEEFHSNTNAEKITLEAESKPQKKGRKPSEKGKVTLTVTIDKDIYQYLDELVEETREHKSMIVNKILFRHMKENRQ